MVPNVIKVDKYRPISYIDHKNPVSSLFQATFIYLKIAKTAHPIALEKMAKNSKIVVLTCSQSCEYFLVRADPSGNVTLHFSRTKLFYKLI